ncbi:MAG: acyloxyacyl hydrolase [Bernardetiaceae bacterium]
MKSCFSLIVLFLLTALALAQPPAHHVAFQAQYGFIIPHSQSIRDVSGSNPWGLKVDWSWHFRSEAAWQYCQCFPRLGVSLEYINFGNPQVLGNAYPVSFWVEPVFGAERRLSGALRFGFGLAPLDRIYDPITNPENLFYSARVSFLLLVNANLRYRLSPRWALQLSSNYNHISNGGLREPNKGINYPTLSLGLDYSLRPQPFPTYRPTGRAVVADSLRQRWQLSLMGSAQNIGEQTRYPLLGLMLRYGRRVRPMHGLSVGAEWVWDFSLRERLRRDDPTSSAAFARGAVLVGHELWLGRFVFTQDLGVYVYAPTPARDPVYQRFGLDFWINRRWSVGMNLKTHLHVADFLDFRLGFSL